MLNFLNVINFRALFVFAFLFASIVVAETQVSREAEEAAPKKKSLKLIADNYFQKPLENYTAFYSSNFNTKIEATYKDSSEIKEEIKNNSKNVDLVLLQKETTYPLISDGSEIKYLVSDELLLISSNKLPTKLTAQKLLLLNGMKKIFYPKNQIEKADLVSLLEKVISDPRKLSQSVSRSVEVASISKGLLGIKDVSNSVLLVYKSQLMKNDYERSKFNVKSFEPRLRKIYPLYGRKTSSKESTREHFVSFLNAPVGRKYFSNYGFLVRK